MKIVIETPTQEDPERVFYYVKQFCIENYMKFKVKIEGTDLEFEKDFKKEEKNEKEKGVLSK